MTEMGISPPDVGVTAWACASFLLRHERYGLSVAAMAGLLFATSITGYAARRRGFTL